MRYYAVWCAVSSRLHAVVHTVLCCISPHDMKHHHTHSTRYIQQCETRTRQAEDDGRQHRCATPHHHTDARHEMKQQGTSQVKCGVVCDVVLSHAAHQRGVMWCRAVVLSRVLLCLVSSRLLSSCFVLSYLCLVLCPESTLVHIPLPCSLGCDDVTHRYT